MIMLNVYHTYIYQGTWQHGANNKSIKKTYPQLRSNSDDVTKTRMLYKNREEQPQYNSCVFISLSRRGGHIRLPLIGSILATPYSSWTPHPPACGRRGRVYNSLSWLVSVSSVESSIIKSTLFQSKRCFPDCMELHSWFLKTAVLQIRLSL